VIIVDRALQDRADAGNPIRVAMVGAGFMGRGIANQILRSTPGMTLAVIANRHLDKARDAYLEAGADPDEIEVVDTVEQLQVAIERGRPAITEDALLACRAGAVDAVVEVTGAIEFGAGVVLEAIEHGKHVVLMNAELDGTIGPILKAKADDAGVLVTACDGDQPGVEMNLYRFVSGIGLTPLLCGNIKGLQDPYRNPTTQEGFAKRWGQNPWMVTSFADGTEDLLRAGHRRQRHRDAGGEAGDDRARLRRPRRRAHRPLRRRRAPVPRGRRRLRGRDPSRARGVRPRHPRRPQAAPLPQPLQAGEGPLYSFYTPYHLCHFEVPTSVARAVLFDDPVLTPLGGPVVDVVATAKVDLGEGTELDAMGGYLTYGQAENHDVVQREGLLPVGLAEGCRLRRPLPKDAVLTYADVEVPPGRLHDALRQEQDQRFG
jgi:predicted homoserine dehydrogenase-like protein